MSLTEGSAIMRSLGSSIFVRSALAAFAALLAVGIALHGDTAKGRAQPVPLVNALGEEELAKFTAVDMADALDRVAGPQPGSPVEPN
jgi:hypothetical protein